MPRELHGVPDGGELWRVDNEWWVVYYVPETDVPLAYEVDETAFEEMVQGGLDDSPDRTISRQAAESELGTIVVGGSSRLLEMNDDPFEEFVNDYERMAEVMPMLRDEEILSIFAQAVLEGREPQQWELERTDYWQGRTQQQRDWEAFAASDPESARQQLESTRLQAANQLRELGYQGDVDSLANYWADQFTFGDISEEQLRHHLEREVDPHHPDASPFAGRHLPDGVQAVTDGRGNFWIRGPDGDYRLTGPGQVARYAGDAVPTGGRDNINEVGTADQFFTRVERGHIDLSQLEQPRYVVDNLGERFITHNGVRYHVTGPGAQRAAEALYGEPEQVGPGELSGFGRGGNAVDFFGGPNQMEKVVAGHIADPFTGRRVDDPQLITAGDGTVYDPEDAMPDEVPSDHDPMAGEEEVRAEIMRWLGPLHGSGWSNEEVARWAGRLRNEGEHVFDELQDKLRRQRLAAFPEYGDDPTLTYEDIASTWRGLWHNTWGEMPDETDPLFDQFLRMNDAHEAQRFLRRKGWERGKGTVVSDVMEGVAQNFGTDRRTTLLN